jgi:capsular exopolysaccharide synthesis family protein
LAATDPNASLRDSGTLAAFPSGWVVAHRPIPLAYYYNILRKRRWLVLAVTVALTAGLAILCLCTTPVYRAYARIQVEAETPLIGSLNELLQKTDAGDAFVQTQIQVLKSENLAGRTIEQLKLADSLIPPHKLANIPEAARKARLIERFEKSLTVELVPRTRMLVVGYENTSPELAAKVATSLAENYIDHAFRQKYDATRQASAWMEQQLGDLKAQVEASQQAVVEYERQNQIVNTNEKQNVLEQMLSDLSRDLTNAESERVQTESLYREVLANRSRIGGLAHNDLLQKLEEKAADLQGQHTEASAQYGPLFPKVLRLQQQIDDNQGQIAREQNRVMERIGRDYDAARNREALAAAAVTAQKERVGKLNQLLVQHNLLQREFEGNQQLYQNLLQRLKEASVSAGLRSTNIQLIDPALTPLRPVRPQAALHITLGFLAGAFLGIVSALARESWDCSVTTAGEVEALLGAPTLAVIPRDSSSGRGKDSWVSRIGRPVLQPRHANIGPATAPMGAHQGIGLTMSRQPQSPTAEAYRTLRTALLLAVGPPAPKRVLVTSTSAGEGKTATALNLALALAQQTGPVLVCDCDLRQGSIARLLGMENTRGLSGVLSGVESLDEAIVPYAAQPRLWVLTAGPAPANPAELLASDVMASVCRQLMARFEHVIMDSPPVLAVTDTTILSHLADGVVLVAESDRTIRDALLRTRSILESTGARILGAVLNKVDLRLLDQGGYGDRSYYRAYPRCPYADS